MAEGSGGGELRRFLLESAPLRGHHLRLGAAWAEMRAIRAYPPAVECLFGETVLASVLLAATLKFDGKLTLQLKGRGLVPLLVAQCTHDFQVRGMASFADTVGFAAGFRELVGDGQLVVTIETGAAGGRYQGIVPMTGDSVAACLEDYFLQSEQLATVLSLHCQGAVCDGVLLQRLPSTGMAPGASEAVAALWQELGSSLRAIPAAAFASATETLLPAIVGQHDCRVFAAAPVHCRCSCGRDRVSDMLRSLGEAEARAVLAEQGRVTITCEFCGRDYGFDAIDIAQLFNAPWPPGAGSRSH